MTAKVEWIAARGKWYLVDRDPRYPAGRKMRALGKTESDREAGERAAAQLNADRTEARHRKADLAGGGMLWGDTLLTAWWAEARGGLADSTRETDEALLLRLRSYFGDLDLRRLSDEQVKAFGGQLADAGLGQHSVHNACSLLRRALHWALEQGYLDRLPVRRICQLGVQGAAARGAMKGERQAWTREEAAVLLELARERSGLYPVVFAAQQSGARKGELLALRWPQVNLAEAKITWGGSRGRKANGLAPKVKSTKANRVRTVDLAPELAELLRGLARDQALTGHGFVFCNRRGQPWDYDALDSAWDRLRIAAQVRGVRPLPWHSWRHTYVSWALAAGEDLAWIARQIGDRIDTMMRNYAHLVPGTRSDHGFLTVGIPAAAPAPAAPASAAAEPGARSRPRARASAAHRPVRSATPARSSGPGSPPSGSARE